MKISVFGLGYVGAVSCGCFANVGHKMVGVDPNKTKVELINDGKSPIVEKDLAELIEKAVKDKHLHATTDVLEAVQNTDISFVCVGTPSQPNGNLDLKFVSRVCEEIGAALKKKSGYHVVVIRSTVLPGTMFDVVIPMLSEHSGKKPGNGFGVCFNPEFLREGTAVYDFHNPPKTVIGEYDQKSGDVLSALYTHVDGSVIRTGIPTAEMVKYVDNTWHGLKVGFANEMGNICKALGIDGHKVMDIFCQDQKLNLSSYYLKPGFAFGGSCLPKDIRALIYKARSLDLKPLILESILPSNEIQVERGLKMVVEKGNKKIGILGFSFKAGTDDLRESPLVELTERLLGKGYDVRLYDQNVNMARLFGANRDFILNHIPHISKLMVDSIDEILAHAQTIIVGNNDPAFQSVPSKIKEGQVIVDLVRIIPGVKSGKSYDGICW